MEEQVAANGSCRAVPFASSGIVQLFAGISGIWKGLWNGPAHDRRLEDSIVVVQSNPSRRRDIEIRRKATTNEGGSRCRPPRKASIGRNFLNAIDFSILEENDDPLLEHVGRG